jgi:hypothetical protein
MTLLLLPVHAPYAGTGVAEFFCTAGFLFFATGAVATGCHTADTARSSGAQDSSLETGEEGVGSRVTGCLCGDVGMWGASLSTLPKRVRRGGLAVKVAATH